jgi:hypothetical protein
MESFREGTQQFHGKSTMSDDTSEIVIWNRFDLHGRMWNYFREFMSKTRFKYISRQIKKSRHVLENDEAHGCYCFG